MTTIHQQIETLSGQSLVWPGHPLVVAFSILRAFPRLSDAKELTSGGHMAAMGSEDVVGSYEARKLVIFALSRLVAGVPVALALGEMSRYWLDSAAEGHWANVVPGIQQALAVERSFLRDIDAWIANNRREQSNAAPLQFQAQVSAPASAALEMAA